MVENLSGEVGTTGLASLTMTLIFSFSDDSELQCRSSRDWVSILCNFKPCLVPFTLLCRFVT